VIAVLGFAGIWWAAPARKWFTGPKVQGSAAELAAIGAELESFSEGSATDAVDFAHAPKSVFSRQAALNRAVRPP
jgi:hypothetical protein